MPSAANVSFERGLLLYRQGRHCDALASLEQTLAGGADGVRVHMLRAAVLIDLKRPAEAAASCDLVLAERPDLPEAHANRAAAMYQLGRYDAALADCDAALALQPRFAAAHAYRGAALYASRRLDAALASLEAALALEPRHAFAHNVMGLALLDLQRPAAALASFDRALALQPAFADAHNNRGIALGDLRELTAAIDSFDRAIALRPEGAEPYFNKAWRYLQAGRFDDGWDCYERRPDAERIIASAALGGRLWDGTQDVRGKTVFTYAEQGLGDTLQFCRYATLLAQRGARVVLGVQATLTALLRDLGPGITVIGLSEPVPDYDYHCPLLSLPRAFRTRLDSIPAAIPYLVPDPARVVEWRRRLGAGNRLIGLRWQGSTRRVDIGRSFPLVCAGALAAVPGVRLISLQKGPGTEQLQSLPASMRVADLGVDFEPDAANAFLDAAAVMCCLDLVITSDTSIAHLAGALGCPTWVALKHMPDWRWLLDREDSPWYPTLRLFRQREPGDWQDVFERMASELSVARAVGEPRSRPQA
jgi:tetratricopeptide (TPR) repeat protein